MGDVFDAMNRSNREKAGSPKPSAPETTANAEVSDEERPGLPMDDVDATPMEEDQEQRRSASDQTVHAASSKATTRAHVTAPHTLTHDPSLNGYSKEVVVHHDRGGIVTEQYRAIRTQLLARSRNRNVRTHVVTSSAPKEGKSVSTVNLGFAFSELKSQRTLLLEADLRKPSFDRLFDREVSPGLFQYLRGETDSIDEITHRTVYDNLDFIAAGGHSSDQTTELLSSPRMKDLIDRLGREYDHIFIDSPPVITVTDPCILGAMCDHVVLVVRLNRTPSDAIDRAKRLLRAANCDVAGVILTHLEQEGPRYLYRYDRYYRK